MREYAGTQLNGNTLLSSVKYNYEDKTNRLSAIVRNSLLGTQEISFVYGNLTAEQNPDAVYTVKHNGTPVLNYNYDPLGRLLTRTIAPINKTQSFTYKQGGHGANSTSALVETVTVDGNTTKYVYDKNGNIEGIEVNDELTAMYLYDSLNQLSSYIAPGNIPYDYYYTNGNITRIEREFETIKTFSYTDPNWPDKLTAFNGNTISYDAIGNPQSYYDYKCFAWENGRQLIGILDGRLEYTYTYNSDGLRTSKDVDGTLTEFIYADGVLLGQTTEDDTLIFLYDESGNKFGFIYNGAYYYYHINPQGDVIGIYNSNGVKVVTYEYDPWGVITNTTDTSGINIGTINPIRYRGYYYDNETGFYYLQSRYYDPNICRFINADGYVSTGQGVLGYNMFAYCNNNPVNNFDPTGTSLSAIGIFTGILAGASEFLSAAVAITAVVTTIGVSIYIGTTLADYLDIAISNAKAEAKSKAKEKEIANTLPPLQEYNYWSAELVLNQVIIKEPLTPRQASFRVATGRNIMCANEAAARYILFTNGYINAVGPERHWGGYLHYHPTRNHTGYDSIHIWFYQ